MDTQLGWKFEQITKWIEQSKDYRERAFFLVAQQIMIEQMKRIEQHQGELDGRMWSPKEW